MSGSKRIALVLFMLLISFLAVACGAASPSESPTLPPVPTSVGPLPSDILQVPTIAASAIAMEGKIDIGDGHTMSYRCYGEGSPTVIVEGGAGDRPMFTSSWNAVILGVSPTTRMCIYDRINARTSEEIAKNLHTMLTKIPLPGPYILVAHSLGGWHARVFAHLYPKDVVGMVLVDTTPLYPDAWRIYATAYPTKSADESAAITNYRMPESAVESGIPPSQDELDMPTSNDQVRQAGSLGDIPLTVISRTAGPDDFSRFDPDTQKQLAGAIQKIQSNMATLSSKGVFIQAITMQQMVSEYQPEIIIDAILKMVEEIRK